MNKLELKQKFYDDCTCNISAAFDNGKKIDVAPMTVWDWIESNIITPLESENAALKVENEQLKKICYEAHVILEPSEAFVNTIMGNGKKLSDEELKRIQDSFDSIMAISNFPPYSDIRELKAELEREMERRKAAENIVKISGVVDDIYGYVKHWQSLIPPEEK